MVCFGGLSSLGKEQEDIRAETTFPSVLGLRCCLKTKWVISRYFKEKKWFYWSPHKLTGWWSGPFQVMEGGAEAEECSL